jgi:hypothetical protein
MVERQKEAFNENDNGQAGSLPEASQHSRRGRGQNAIGYEASDKGVQDPDLD